MAVRLSRRGLLPTRTALFRVDAGPGIGMGHFMRCHTLAMEMISHGWDVFFIGSGLPTDLVKGRLTTRQGINVIPIPLYNDTVEDVTDLLEIIRSSFASNAECLIVDTYRYSREDFAMLHTCNYYRIPVIVIDDIASRDTPAQAVINPNPLFDPEPYRRQKIPFIMCGSEYTLIRPEIQTMRHRKYCADGPLVITLGGGDVEKYLMKVLAAIPDDFSRRICVSISENCPRQNLETWINKDPCNRFLNTDSAKFPEILASASIAITGGGTTLWEVYCLGIPSLSLVWVDNQKQTSVIIKEQATSFLIDIVSNINLELKSDWLDSGLKTLVENFGLPCQTRILQEEAFRASEVINREQTSVLVDNCDMIDIGFIRKTLSQLTAESDIINEMISRQQNLIDGLGAQRCYKIIDEIGWTRVELFASDWRNVYENRSF